MRIEIAILLGAEVAPLLLALPAMLVLRVGRKIVARLLVARAGVEVLVSLPALLAQIGCDLLEPSHEGLNVVMAFWDGVQRKPFNLGYLFSCQGGEMLPLGHSRHYIENDGLAMIVGLKARVNRGINLRHIASFLVYFTSSADVFDLALVDFAAWESPTLALPAPYKKHLIALFVKHDRTADGNLVPIVLELRVKIVTLVSY